MTTPKRFILSLIFTYLCITKPLLIKLLLYILFSLRIFCLTYYAGGLTPKRRRIITIPAPIWTGIVVNAISGISRQVPISTKGQLIYDPSRKQQQQQHKQQTKKKNGGASISHIFFNVQ